MAPSAPYFLSLEFMSNLLENSPIQTQPLIAISELLFQSLPSIINCYVSPTQTLQELPIHSYRSLVAVLKYFVLQKKKILFDEKVFSLSKEKFVKSTARLLGHFDLITHSGALVIVSNIFSDSVLFLVYY